jgi:hypothetical protein
LLVKVTVALTVEPTTPLVGRAIVVLTSDSSAVSVRVVVLFAVLISGKPVAPTPAVTVAPALVTVTTMGTVTVPPGGTLVLVVWVTPLMTMVAVKLVVAEPWLVKVTVALTVEPTTPLVGRAIVVLTSDSSTVKVAVTVTALLPTDVVNEPAGMVFVPSAVLVTTAETEQDALGGITVPELTLRDVAPGAAVTVELTQVVAGGGAAALAMLGGYRSTKVGVNVAEARA